MEKTTFHIIRGLPSVWASNWNFGNFGFMERGKQDNSEINPRSKYKELNPHVTRAGLRKNETCMERTFVEVTFKIRPNLVYFVMLQVPFPAACHHRHGSAGSACPKKKTEKRPPNQKPKEYVSSGASTGN